MANRLFTVNVDASIAAILIQAVLIGWLSLRPLRKIAFGMGWSRSVPLITAVLLGINSAFCCGLIGYIVVQQIATNELCRYGLHTSAFGVNSKARRLAIHRLEEKESLNSAPKDPTILQE